MSTGTQMILFCQGGYTEEWCGFAYVALYVHWSPYSTSSPLLEGQWGLTVCQRVRQTWGSSSDKTTKQKHLLLHSSVPKSVWGKETNLKQLLFSPCVFKTQRQKCPSDFKGTRLDFDKNWTRRTRTESITVEHTCVTYSHLPGQQLEGDLVWLEISWAYLLVTFRSSFTGTIVL